MTSFENSQSLRPEHSSRERSAFWRRPGEGLLVLIVLALALWGIRWWYGSSDREETTRTAASANGEADLRAGTVKGDRQQDGDASSGRESPGSAVSSTASEGNTEIDFEKTSWNRPFTEAHWNSHGWAFDEGTMHSEGEGPAEATFGRAYRKLTVDCRLVRPVDSGHFAIVLTEPESKTRLSGALEAGAVVVSAVIDGKRRMLERRKLPDSQSQAEVIDLRITATGNRVLVHAGGRFLMSCDQPARQSGRDLKLSLVSRGGQFRLTQLRIEGE